jgi:hypothetical protein
MIVRRQYYTLSSGRRVPAGFLLELQDGRTLTARRWSDGSGTRIILNPYCWLDGPNRGALKLAAYLMREGDLAVHSSKGDRRRKAVAALFAAVELPAGWRRTR